MCICHALKQVKIDRRRSKCKQPTSTQKHYERSVVIEVPICQHLQKESLILPGASIRQQRLAYQGFQSWVYEDREAASVPSCGRPGESSSSLCHSSSAEWPFSQWLSDYWAETQNLHMLWLFFVACGICHSPMSVIHTVCKTLQDFYHLLSFWKSDWGSLSTVSSSIHKTE